MLRRLRAGEEWVHTSAIARERGSAGGDFAQLAHWGLIENKPSERDPKKRANGWWRLTEAGKAFALGRTRVPRHADIYNGSLLGLDATETVDIRGTLGADFNYEELMQATPASIPDLAKEGGE
jgi:hypothetical protein